MEDPATLANGRFEIRGKLGSGGAGVVYRVHDQQLQREVALKLLRQASGRDLFRFKREFRSLADIVHPNLVALHELHASQTNDWYITMELVEGVSFIDWTRPGRMIGPQRTRADIHEAKLDLARLRSSLAQLADALHALHLAGKLHRDLKPSNVLVTATGRVVLLDFGLITSVAEGNPEHLAVGTPVYMSPEQASDQPIAGASDWYGVGAMLYEALTGRRPFEGDPEQVMTRKQSELPAPPEKLAGGVPADLAKLCLALLQPRPDVRPKAPAIFEQLDTAPSANTRAIERGVLGGFVGREKELELLERALADARRTGTAVLVCGKSGIGKSTLVRTFLDGLGDGVFVAAGRCFEREAVPFKMLDGVIDALTGAILTLPPVEIARIAPPEIGSLVRMFPVLRRIEQLSDLVTDSVPSEPQELRRRGFRGLKTLIGRLAHVRPVVIFVDDAHWGDADSAAFFARWIHEPEKGTLAIFAHRPEDYLGVVSMLRRPPSGARHGELQEIVVEPFDDALAKRIVVQLGVDQHEARAAIAIAAAAGNPLVLTEMARAPTLASSTGIDDLVRERVLRLPVDAQAMLAVSSIAARPLPVEIAAHAAGVVGGLEAATRLSIERLATLHQVDGDMILHPAHDYVRTSVLANLDIETRAGFHEAIARAFEAVQGSEQLDSLAVVEHWLAAGHPANAAHHAVAAAQLAEDQLAFRRAADLYEVALAFGPWDTAGQRDLLRRKAHALACAGQLDEAATVYGHAAQLLPDAEAIDLERLRVEALLRRGRLDEALPAAEALLSQIGTRIPLGRASRTRLATQWLAAKLRGLDFVERDPTTIPPADLLAIDVLYSIASGLAFADPGLGRVVQGQLTRAALAAGEPIRVCLALAQEVWYAAAGGSRNRVAVDAVSQRLRAIALRVGRPEVIGFADTACGIATHMSGRWRDARASLESGLAALRDRGAGVRWEIDIAETFWLATLFYLGDWREMSRQTISLLRDAVDRADVVAQQNLRIGHCNFAWLALDRPDEAREQLEIALRTLPQDSFRLQDASVMLAAANIDLYTGDAAAARRRIDSTWDQLDRIGCLRIQQLRVELTLLRARTQLALGGHDPEQQRAALQHANALLKEGAPWATGLGHLIRASCHAHAGAGEAARSDLVAAEEHLVSTAMLGYLQIARWRRGEIEGGTMGSSRVTAAREILGDLGATSVDTMIRHLLPWPESGPRS